jgi:peptidoglycan hydrolase-like protein with peptidoglycan-binding domain
MKKLSIQENRLKQAIQDIVALEPMIYGERNSNVEQLQSILGIISDGIFGKDTLKAVRAFQTAHGLLPDGIVGPKTQAALQELNK